MSKYKEILRYLMTTSLSGRAIAKSLSVGRDTVQNHCSYSSDFLSLCKCYDYYSASHWVKLQ